MGCPALEVDCLWQCLLLGAYTTRENPSNFFPVLPQNASMGDHRASPLTVAWTFFCCNWLLGLFWQKVLPVYVGEIIDSMLMPWTTSRNPHKEYLAAVKYLDCVCGDVSPPHTNIKTEKRDEIRTIDHPESTIYCRSYRTRATRWTSVLLIPYCHLYLFIGSVSARPPFIVWACATHMTHDGECILLI